MSVCFYVTPTKPRSHINITAKIIIPGSICMWRKKNVSMESIILTSSAPFKAGSIIQRPRKLEIMHYCVQLWSEKVQCLLLVLRLFPVPIEQLTNVQMLSLQFYIALIVWQNLEARARDVFSIIPRTASAWRVAGLSFSKLFLGNGGFSKLWELAHSAMPEFTCW